jgi:hypothetical protein
LAKTKVGPAVLRAARADAQSKFEGDSGTIWGMTARNEVAVLERMIGPDVADIPADAARFFLSLDFSESDQARIDELSERARSGTLTQQERDDLDAYIRLSDFLAFIQSKSRRSLRDQAIPAA